MLRLAIILALIWSSYCEGNAQTSYTVRGVIRDTAGVALSKATILLLNKKDSLISISQEDGSFLFAKVEIKQAQLIVSMKGYTTARKEVVFKEGEYLVDIDPILLSVDYTRLDPVVISRVRPIIIGLDTISYQAAAFHVRDGSELEELLKQLPGIEVDMDGNVIVQGKKVTRVRVDGKDFFGGDVLTATRNLPADIVNKVQVIDDYGDKARLTGIKSGGSVKILNIELKADKRTGQFGHIQTSVGSENKYAGEAFANFFKNERQFSLNGTIDNTSPAGNNYAKNMSVHYANRWNKRWFGEGNASFSSDDPSNTGSTVQDNYYAIGQLHQEQVTHTNGNNHASSYGSTITYTPDLYHTFRISPSFTIQDSRQSASSVFSTIQQDSGFNKSTEGAALTKTGNTLIATRADIYYEQLSAHSKNRFSALLNVQYNNSQATNDNLTNVATIVNSLSSQSVLHYLINNSGNNWSTNLNINYFSPLGKSAFLEFSYTWNSSIPKNTKNTLEPDSIGNQLIKVDSLSNSYFFRSITHRLHTGYSAQIKNINFSLSLDGQPGSMQGTISGKEGTAAYHYFVILPTGQANWALTPFRTLSFQYNGNPELPALQQLQPLTDRSNPQYPVTGNPSLKPAFSQNISLHYEQSTLKPTQFQGFGLGLSYNSSRHVVIPHIVHPKDTGSVIQETTFLNAGGISSLHLDYHLNLPSFCNKRLRITINGSIALSQSDAMTDNILYTTRTQALSEGMHFQYTIPNVFESDLAGNYNIANTRYPVGGTSPVTFSSAAWSLRNRHIFFRKWILNYNISQGFNSGVHGGLEGRTAFLTAAIQRQFLSKNRGTFSITGYDLLNSNAGISQSISATNITKSQTNFIGRYFMVNLIWKWGKFGE